MGSGVLGWGGWNQAQKGTEVLGPILKDGVPHGCLQPSFLCSVQAWENLAHEIQLAVTGTK